MIGKVAGSHFISMLLEEHRVLRGMILQPQVIKAKK
jgi:hypothetical protein